MKKKKMPCEHARQTVTLNARSVYESGMNSLDKVVLGTFGPSVPLKSFDLDLVPFATFVMLLTITPLKAMNKRHERCGLYIEISHPMKLYW